MSRDFLTLGSTPWNEDCAGVGEPEYEARSIAECKRYKTLLEGLFPVPDGVYGSFGIKSFPHDFDTYREAVAYYDPDDRQSCEWAFDVENRLPDSWESGAVPNGKVSILVPTF
jgi:hypothetical protein